MTSVNGRAGGDGLQEAREYLLGLSESAVIIKKLDELLEFQRQLAPYLPLLAKVAAMIDNPAAKFRDVARFRKTAKEPK